MSNPIKIQTPVGRLVGGSLYDPELLDFDGKPRVGKPGTPNAGQPMPLFSFSVAFPKTPGVQHWGQEQWLAPIWALGHASFPNGEAGRPDFAWKITDGDSQVPGKGRGGKPGRKPCENPGYAGNWVIRFGSGVAPKICDAKGTAYILEKDVVKCGYYVQVLGNVVDNKPSASPGMYWNPSIVAFSGHGEEISFGPSLNEASFGNAPLPPGASPAPLGGIPLPNGAPPVPGSASAYPVAPALAPAPISAAPVRVMTAKANGATYEQFMATGQWTDERMIAEGYMLGAPPAPLQPLPGSVPTPGVPAPIASVPVPVSPNPAFVQIPGIPVPTVPAPVPQRVMTPKANGATYEQFMATGQWTDALLVQQGYMQP